MSTTPRALPEDLQQSLPSAPISLSKAGVSRSAKAIRIRHDGAERLFHAEIACSCDLNPAQKGVHMSRFEESVNEAIDEVVIGAALRIEELAERIALRVVEGQRALRSEVTIRASYPVERRTPVTDIPTQEMYGLIGIAAANGRVSRKIVGVTAQGMNACPCAQGLIRDQAAEALRTDGFGEDEIERIVALVPVATHNQRARGTLLVGGQDSVDVDADRLIEIVENGMSSEIYELMKRPDERYVVDRAHRRPRFVEDSVREMVRGVLDAYPDLADEVFVHAHQVNFETIHTHDVDAERSGTVGEIRRELVDGEHVADHTTLSAWLEGRVPRPS
ncbi:MAG: GTP cyclohydrolase MptA [Thermoleophilia bacterium]